MSPSSEAWQNEGAGAALLTDLADRGIVVSVVAGRLHLVPGDALTVADRALLQQQRAAVLVAVLCRDRRTRDRLEGLRTGRLPLWPGAVDLARCYVCGGALPGHRPLGRCGPCAVASRLFVGAPVPLDVLDLYDDETAGPRRAGLFQEAVA